MKSRGFSLVELLIVLTVITILTGISLFYLSSHQALYRPDEQALKIIDMLQEARQRSLTQREAMRVEIDLTDNIVRLIDENGPNSAEDDTEIRAAVLLSPAEVKIDRRPPDITTDPAESLPVPIAQFKASLHPLSGGNNVCTFRFLRNGTVVNDGTDSVGTNATTTGATIFVWSPKKDEPNESNIARAITVVGASGSVRYWEYNRSLSETNILKDSRRSVIYGGTTANP